jgi:hypothetical protein
LFLPIPRLAQALSALAQAWATLRSAFGAKCIVPSFIVSEFLCASWDDSQEAYDKNKLDFAVKG